MRCVGDLRGFVVSNFRGQRRDQHQRVLDVPINLGAIHLDSLDHVLDVAMAGVSEQRDRMQEVVDDHRLENIEFEVALRPGESYRSGSAMNLQRTPWSWLRIVWDSLCRA